MNIATILFTYHRYDHTKATLEGIKNNTVSPSKLYIFQDGIGDRTNVDEWNKVNALIHDVDFCDTEVNVSDHNKGLANSVVNGVNYVFESNDAVIVLEDDCVPHPLFIDFVIRALKKYKDESKVWSVNGHIDNINLDDIEGDTFFNGRADSWGWATWKDRWKYYEIDYKLISKIRNDKYKSEQLDIWGGDLETYVLGNIYGKCDSWAVFWDLQVIYRGGYCLHPVESLIHNIGCDGSGTHSVNATVIEPYRDINNLSPLVLPEKVEFPKNYKSIFSEFFHRTSPAKRDSLYKNLLLDWFEVRNNNISIADRLLGQGIRKVSIWGTGRISKLLINEIRNKVEISQIIKSDNPEEQNEFEGVEVVAYYGDNLRNDVDAIIVIPFYDKDFIKKKIKSKNIKADCIGIEEIISRNYNIEYLNRRISRYKHIHIIVNDKFSAPFISFINNNYSMKDHFMIVYRNDKYPVPEYENVALINSMEGLDFSSDSIKQIIIHSLCANDSVKYFYDNPEFSRKAYWMIWGGDLYDAPRDEINDFVRKGFKGYISDTDGDCQVVRERYDLSEKRFFNAAYTFPIEIEMIDNALRHRLDNKEIRIQINNSCDKTTLDVLDQLTKYRNRSIKIVTVLSYGNVEYKNEIIKKGNDLFGEKFEYLDQFLSPKEYTEWLSKNDIYILSQDRQQGLGNSFASLALGVKLYIKSDVTTYNHFNSRGIKVFDTYDIDSISYEDLIDYDPKIREKNMELVRCFFDDSYLKKCWDPVFNDV